MRNRGEVGEGGVRKAFHLLWLGRWLGWAQIYQLDHIMADGADALGNATKAVFGDDLSVLMCWVHVWRAVKAKHHLLKRNTEERQNRRTGVAARALVVNREDR